MVLVLGYSSPVLGLVQVGDAAMADRYAYVPLIGIFVMIAWAWTTGRTRKTWVRFAGRLSVGRVNGAWYCHLSPAKLLENEYTVWAHAVSLRIGILLRMTLSAQLWWSLMRPQH